MAEIPYIGAFILFVSAFVFCLVPSCRRFAKRLIDKFASRSQISHDHTPPPAHFTGWTFCPLCSSRLEVRAVCDRPRLACTSKRCQFVHWDNPKPVALCLVEVDGGLVLTRRKFPPRVGTWCIPGGFVEAHEAPELAAKRETWEETGLLVEVTNLLGVYSPCQGGNEVVIVFSARVVGGALKAGDEVLELGVFKQDKLPTDIGFPQHLEIIQYWFKGELAARGIDPPSNHCESGPKGQQQNRTNTMKVGNFITHTLIFLTAWIGLALWSWGSAQVVSNTILLPWVLSVVSLSSTTVAFAMGGAVAILGSLLAAMVLLVVLIALEAIVHFLQGPSAVTPS